MKIISPFGPKIAVIKIPKKIIILINKEVETILKNKEKLKKNNYSNKLVGQVKQEFQLSKNFINKHLIRFINNSVKTYIKKSSNRNVKRISLKNLWIVRQFKNEYNPIHFHSGDISGVGYLKVPKDMTKNKLIKNKKDKTNGTIDFINGQKGFLSRSIFNIVPKERDLIIFPNYLMHTAYPFNINAERRSFSFNAKIILRK